MVFVLKSWIEVSLIRRTVGSTEIVRLLFAKTIGHSILPARSLMLLNLVVSRISFKLRLTQEKSRAFTIILTIFDVSMIVTLSLVKIRHVLVPPVTRVISIGLSLRKVISVARCCMIRRVLTAEVIVTIHRIVGLLIPIDSSVFIRVARLIV